MTDPKKKTDQRSGAEDEVGAKVNDPNSKPDKPVDSFKSGSKKQARYFDQPFDEQMYDPDARMGDQDDPK
jgi:hypothetical protein